MITRKTYRYIAAALLLILYVFICLPAHIWHHHDHACFPDESSRGSCDIPAIRKAVDASQENCAVCAHQYAGYCNDSCILLIATAADIAFLNGCHIVSYVPALPVQLPNKGPPGLTDLTGF